MYPERRITVRETHLPILLVRRPVARVPECIIPPPPMKLLGLYLFLVGPRSLIALIKCYPPLLLPRINFNNI
jgi:hypothetical protein